MEKLFDILNIDLSKLKNIKLSNKISLFSNNIKKIVAVLESLETEELITGSSVNKTSKTVVLRLTLKI